MQAMTNIATAIKAEISRVARKEIRAEIEQLKKASARYRGDIATLKRENAELAKRVSLLEKHIAKAPPGTKSQSGTAPSIRFSADGLKKLRIRHGLSGPVLAGILDVSPQTVYNWEDSVSRPNKETLAKIAVLRGMSTREVRERLAVAKAAK